MPPIYDKGYEQVLGSIYVNSLNESETHIVRNILAVKDDGCDFNRILFMCTLLMKPGTSCIRCGNRFAKKEDLPGYSRG